jgi:hypothetical protein
VRKHRWLVLTIFFVVAIRLAFYAVHPKLGTDFDQLYNSALSITRGENPYVSASHWWPYPLFYPLPAVLIALPFTIFPVQYARPVFDICCGAFFAWALWKYRGPYALLAVYSGAYLVALAWGQTTPLVTAASLVPVLGFLLPVKPNQGLALFAARPSWRAVLSSTLILAVSLLVLPSWPVDWWNALHQQNTHLSGPVMRPFGWILLLAALRWDSPEGRLLFAVSLVPQTLLPYEFVPLVLIPKSAVEMGIFAVGSWIACAAYGRFIGHYELAALIDKVWPTMLGVVYLPMLYLVLTRSSHFGMQTSLSRLFRRIRLGSSTP